MKHKQSRKARIKSRQKAREVWGAWENVSDRLAYGNKVEEITEAWRNLVYTVQISYESCNWGEIIHLWVRRNDEGLPTWQELQRIKNRFAGPERTAVEVYPAKSDLVDQANMFHLWVLPEGVELPFSLKG